MTLLQTNAMFNLPYFKEENKHVLFQFLNDYPFAFLTASFDEKSYRNIIDQLTKETAALKVANEMRKRMD